ncbi:hypothetical protein ACU686_14140 [Yinghuangia aomiensis]
MGGAALDVLEGEEGVFYADRRATPRAGSLLARLQQMPNVVVSPHTAYYAEHALCDTVANSSPIVWHLRRGTEIAAIDERTYRHDRQAQSRRTFRGCSEEHAVSVKSAREVARNLAAATYEPLYVGITRSGAWKLCDGPDGDWENGDGRTAVLSPDRSAPGLLVLADGEYETIGLDVVVARAARQVR